MFLILKYILQSQFNVMQNVNIWMNQTNISADSSQWLWNPYPAAPGCWWLWQRWQWRSALLLGFWAQCSLQTHRSHTHEARGSGLNAGPGCQRSSAWLHDLLHVQRSLWSVSQRHLGGKQKMELQRKQVHLVAITTSNNMIFSITIVRLKPPFPLDVSNQLKV